MRWLAAAFLSASVQLSFSIIFPVKKPDGSIDFDSLLNHMVLLEQTVVTLQKESKTQASDIAALRAKFGVLQSQLGTGSLSSEVTSLKDELFATRTEVQTVSSEVISVNSELKTMTADYQSLKIQMNDTNREVQDLKVSVDSSMFSFNGSLQAQQNITNAIQADVKRTEMALQSFKKNFKTVNSSLSSEVASLKQATTNSVHAIQQGMSDLQIKLRSNQNTLNGNSHLLDAVLRTLNLTKMEESVLKTDLALAKKDILNSQKDLQTAFNTMSSMFHSIDILNGTIQLHRSATSTLSNEVTQNTASIQSLQRNNNPTVNAKMSSIVDRLKLEVSFEVQSPATYVANTVIRFTSSTTSVPDMT